MNLAENSIFDQFVGLGWAGLWMGLKAPELWDTWRSSAKCYHREFHRDTKTWRSSQAQRGRVLWQSISSVRRCRLSNGLTPAETTAWEGTEGCKNHEGNSEVTKENSLWLRRKKKPELQHCYLIHDQQAQHDHTKKSTRILLEFLSVCIPASAWFN